MTMVNRPTKKKRQLPAYVLKPEYKAILHLEAQAVQEKFCKYDSKFGERNVDTVALSYMSAEAVLYWLPIFLNYLRHDAPRDSFQFENWLYTLCNEDRFVAPVRALATGEERDLILAYLDWWESTLPPPDREVTGRQIPIARKLWS
jgi:hypothetical protein